MINTDLHLHTCFSHGCDLPAAMYASAQGKGLKLIGFSEHSPRPEGFDYTHEYREHLTRHWADYVEQVGLIKKRAAQAEGEGGDPCQVMFGIEMDWLDGEEHFIRESIAAYDYDYVIGSVHFLDRWGFDDGGAPWQKAAPEQCEIWYEQYFIAWKAMLQSGLFQIAAHPDLIKIYSLDRFHVWLAKPASRDLVRECLLALRDSGMIMEISSAGLRKPCHEIYPCKEIMALAADLKLSVCFASDAHCVNDAGYAFDQLESYARAFGFNMMTIPNRGVNSALPF